MFKFKLKPREDKFFDLFEKSAKNGMAIAQAFKAMVESWDNIADRVAAIDDMEHQGDSITHEIMYQLNRTFVTPLDREDIALLAHSLDDIADFVHAAADSMLIYKVNRPNELCRELAGIIVEIASGVEQAVPKLRDRDSGLKQVMSACVEINRLENVADRVYRSALAELFENNRDLADVIKWREILEYMESATDRCEDVANVLEGVALKHG